MTESAPWLRNATAGMGWTAATVPGAGPGGVAERARCPKASFVAVNGSTALAAAARGATVARPVRRPPPGVRVNLTP